MINIVSSFKNSWDSLHNFQHYYLSTFHTAMQNSCSLFIFGCVLKPTLRENVSKLFFNSTVNKLA